MTNTRDIILKLKEVRESKNLSYQNIMDMMEKNGDYIAKSTLSRLFAEGSENMSFKYDETIRPIAKALLDIEQIEDDDTMDVQAMKVLLKYKIGKIEELEKKIDKERLNHHDKIEKERTEYEKKIDFLKTQITRKDERIDKLMQMVEHLMSKLDIVDKEDKVDETP